MIYWIDGAHEGFKNMAIDESMAQVAVERRSPILRIYRWERAFLTLGYFQSAKDIQSITELQQLPFARRLSGGGAIVHHHELTYCLSVPDNTGSKSAAGDLYCLVHKAIANFFTQQGCMLSSSGCQVPTDRDSSTDGSAAPFLCFERRSSSDLLYGVHKIVGSAQRRLGGAILQHGSILLSRSMYAPQLPGIADLVEPSKSSKFSQPERLAYPLAKSISGPLAVHFGNAETSVSEADNSLVNEIIGTANAAEGRFRSTDWNCRR